MNSIEQKIIDQIGNEAQENFYINESEIKPKSEYKEVEYSFRKFRKNKNNQYSEDT